MPSVLIDDNMFESLTNKELVEKQEELEIKYSKAMIINSLPYEQLLDMEKVLKIIDNEINKRLANGTMDEDELDDEL